MNKLVLALLLCAFSSIVVADMDKNTTEAKKITGAFFNDLKNELTKGLKAGGTVNSIGLCKGIAPAIADKHTERTGWAVGRTSLKLRNPNNAPDEWEAKVLLQFEEQRAKGQDADKLIYTEIVDEGGDKYFRFMKAIVMPPMEKMPCLKCHGEHIDSDTASVIDRLYPLDKARGYKAGEVRGAFTLKKKL